MSSREDRRPPRLGSTPNQIPTSVRDRILEHPTRGQIIELLGKRPGMDKDQVCDELDVQSNLLNFHLGKLEDINVVAMRPSAQDREILCSLQEDLDLRENDRTRSLFG